MLIQGPNRPLAVEQRCFLLKIGRMSNGQRHVRDMLGTCDATCVRHVSDLCAPSCATRWCMSRERCGCSGHMAHRLHHKWISGGTGSWWCRQRTAATNETSPLPSSLSRRHGEPQQRIKLVWPCKQLRSHLVDLSFSPPASSSHVVPTCSKKRLMGMFGGAGSLKKVASITVAPCPTLSPSAKECLTVPWTFSGTRHTT